MHQATQPAKLKNPSLIYRGFITTLPLEENFDVDASVEKPWLIFRWHTPLEEAIYEDSNVLVKLSSPTLYTIDSVATWSGYIRTKITAKNVWNVLEVFLEFDGYTGKRLELLLRGRILSRYQGKWIICDPLIIYTLCSKSYFILPCRSPVLM